MTFGEKLKRRRLELNLSQTELGALAGISERTIYSYEQLGKQPRKSNLAAIAEALETTPEYLTDETIEPEGFGGMEEEYFYTRVRKAYGEQSFLEARQLMNKASAMFAGGALDDDTKEIFRQSLMRMYLESKELSGNTDLKNRRVTRKREHE